MAGSWPPSRQHAGTRSRQGQTPSSARQAAEQAASSRRAAGSTEQPMAAGSDGNLQHSSSPQYARGFCSPLKGGRGVDEP